MAQTHIPQKEIKLLEQVAFYHSTEAYRRLMTFITRVNEAIMGKTIHALFEPYHPSFDKILEAFTELDVLIARSPPVSMTQRYGNVAFRQWYANMETACSLSTFLFSWFYRSCQILYQISCWILIRIISRQFYLTP